MISSKTTMQHQEISLLEALSESSNVKGVLAQVPESMDLNSASPTVSVQSDNSHFSTLISDTFLSNGIPETVGLTDILSSAHKAPDISAGLETFAAGGDTSSIHNPVELEDTETQWIDLDGTLIKGILAFGDDGNQYIIPASEPGSTLQPFQVVAGSSPGSFSLPKLNPPSTQTQPTPVVSSLTDSSSITFSIPVPNSCTNYSTGNSNHLENLLESPAEAISVISTKLKNTTRNAHGARKMIKRVYRPVSKAKPGVETVSQVLQPSETADFQPCIMLDGTEQYSIQGSNQIVDLTGLVVSETIPLVLDPATGQLIPQELGSTQTQGSESTSLHSSKSTLSTLVQDGDKMYQSYSENGVSRVTKGFVLKPSVTYSDQASSKDTSLARVKPFSVSSKNISYEIFSLLSNKARTSTVKRKVSRVKCQCTNHIIIGYPPSDVHYWEVEASRDPGGLNLNFLNPGVKYLYDEGLLKAFKSALSCLKTENTRNEVSLEVSICLTCVRWGEVEFAKLKQGIDKDQGLTELPPQGTVKLNPEIPVLKPPLLNKPVLLETNTPRIEETATKINLEDLLRDGGDSKTQPGISERRDKKKEVGNNVDEVDLRDKVQHQPGEKKERRKPRRSSTNNPGENVYKKVYNNIRRSSGETTRKVEGNVQAKNSAKKDFLYDLICDIPGCDVKVRSYKFLEAHFKAKHPLLVIPAREANNDTFNQKMEKMANEDANDISTGPSSRLDTDNGSTGPSRGLDPDNGSTGPSRRLDPGNISTGPSRRLDPGNRSTGPSRRLDPDNGSTGPSRRLDPDNGSTGPSRRLDPDNGSTGPSRRLDPGNRSTGPSSRLDPDNGSTGPSTRLDPDNLYTGTPANSSTGNRNHTKISQVRNLNFSAGTKMQNNTSNRTRNIEIRIERLRNVKALLEAQSICFQNKSANFERCVSPKSCCTIDDKVSTNEEVKLCKPNEAVDIDNLHKNNNNKEVIHAAENKKTEITGVMDHPDMKDLDSDCADQDPGAKKFLPGSEDKDIGFEDHDKIPGSKELNPGPIGKIPGSEELNPGLAERGSKELNPVSVGKNTCSEEQNLGTSRKNPGSEELNPGSAGKDLGSEKLNSSPAGINPGPEELNLCTEELNPDGPAEKKSGSEERNPGSAEMKYGSEELNSVLAGNNPVFEEPNPVSTGKRFSSEELNSSSAGKHPGSKELNLGLTGKNLDSEELNSGPAGKNPGSKELDPGPAEKNLGSEELNPGSNEESSVSKENNPGLNEHVFGSEGSSVGSKCPRQEDLKLLKRNPRRTVKPDNSALTRLILRNSLGEVLSFNYDEANDKLGFIKPVPAAGSKATQSMEEVRSASKDIKTSSVKFKKKKRSLINLQIDMVSDTFNPTKKRRTVKNEVEDLTETSRDLTKTKKKIIGLDLKRLKTSKSLLVKNRLNRDNQLSKKGKPGTVTKHSKSKTNANNQSRKIRSFGKNQRFAEILFQRMIDKAVPAADAFKILRSRVNGLEFNDFEEEYRKYYLKNLSANVEENHESKTTSTSPKNDLSNNSSLLEQLTLIETKVQGILNGNHVFNDEEFERLDHIRDMLNELVSRS